MWSSTCPGPVRCSAVAGAWFSVDTRAGGRPSTPQITACYKHIPWSSMVKVHVAVAGHHAACLICSVSASPRGLITCLQSVGCMGTDMRLASHALLRYLHRCVHVGWQCIGCRGPDHVHRCVRTVIRKWQDCTLVGRIWPGCIEFMTVVQLRTRAHTHTV